MDGTQGVLNNRPGGRTITISVVGVGAAAFVTSIPVMSLEGDAVSLAVAVVGGTAVLAVSAAITILCALKVKRDRAMWLLAGLSLALTQAGSGIRAGAVIAGQGGEVGSLAELLYAAGIVLYGAALVAWPWSRSSRLRMGLPVIETAIVSAVVGTAFWLLMGGDMVRTAYVSGSLDPVMMQQYLGLVLLAAACAVFTFASVFHLRGTEPLLPWTLAGLSMVAVLVGDVSWLWSMTATGWQPGALGDFVHITGHVMVAVAASLAIDNESAAARDIRVADTGADSPSQ